MNANCISCGIVAGKSPASHVFEDNETLAFADIHPASRGHILVIPKAHYPDIYHLPPETAGRIMQTTVQVAKAIKSALKPEGINLVQANEPAAHQDVFHFHMHIIPRYRHWREDKSIVLDWAEHSPSREELDEMAKNLSKEVR